MRKTFKCAFALLAVGLTAGLSSCDFNIKRGEYAQGSVSIYCDDGFKNILEEEIDVFEYSYPGSSIIPKYVSEQDAIDAFLNDKTDAIITTRELSKAQTDKILKDYNKRVIQSPIAVDAVALVVNKDNPMETVTMEEIGKLLNGEINQWSQLAVDVPGKVELVFDNQGSSTVSYLRDKFLGGKKISGNPNVNVSAVNNNWEVLNIIKKRKDAIGIVSVSCLGDTLQFAKHLPMEERVEKYETETEIDASKIQLTTEVKILAVSNPNELNQYSVYAFKPYQTYIESGEYPLVRIVYMATTGANKLGKSFYDFMTGFVGQKIITLTGILPYRNEKRVIEASR